MLSVRFFPFSLFAPKSGICQSASLRGKVLGDQYILGSPEKDAYLWTELRLDFGFARRSGLQMASELDRERPTPLRRGS